MFHGTALSSCLHLTLAVHRDTNSKGGSAHPERGSSIDSQEGSVLPKRGSASPKHGSSVDPQGGTRSAAQRAGGRPGSIGTQTLEVVRLFPERFEIRALTAGSNADLLVRQAREFQPACVVIGTEARRKQLEDALPGVRVLVGREGLCEAATLPEVDAVMASLVGFAGLGIGRRGIACWQEGGPCKQGNAGGCRRMGHPTRLRARWDAGARGQ